jgi:hypothetical protein
LFVVAVAVVAADVFTNVAVAFVAAYFVGFS